MKRKKHYKFTEKKHSKRGMVSCIIAAASIFVLLYSFYASYLQQGNGSVYLGCLGMAAFAAAGIGFFHAVKSILEDGSFKTIPILAIILSFAAAGAWIIVYAAGFAAVYM